MFSTISVILWKTLINNDAAGGASSFSRKGRSLTLWCFRKNKRNGGVPLICQPAAATFPQGKALAWCNCRGPYNHQGSAPKRGNRGTVTPLHPSAEQSHDTNGTRLPIIGNKGVLRTIGSKLIFAYFCSATKVGRRRHNTIRNTVGYRQKKTALVSGTKK